MQLPIFVRRLRASAWGNSLIVMFGFLLSRVTGLLRDIVISQAFGTSAELGAYRAAFKVTDLLYIVIIGGALGSSFIPVFIQAWERNGEERAWRLASAVLTWALLVLTVASALLWLFAPQLTFVVYGAQDGFAPDVLDLTTRLTRLFLLSPLVLGLGGLAMAALNARERFALPALAPSVYNIGIIAGALFLAPTLGVWGLAWGVVLGAACYLLVQLPGLMGLGMRLRLTLGREMAEVGTVARQMAPRVMGQSAAQVSILVTAALAARLVAGGEKLAALDYAYQIMLLPYGIFSLSLSTVAFPKLARLFADGQLDELAQSVRQTLRTILFLTLPATGALAVLAVPIVRVLFQRGDFDAVSLQYTVAPLIGYATALPAFAASEILIRTFFAMQRTWVPVLVGLLQVSLNASLGLLMLYRGGDAGMLALAFSVANNIEALLLLLLLQRRLPQLWRDRGLFRSLFASLGASCGLTLLLLVVREQSAGWLPALLLSGNYRWQQDLPLLLGWLVLVGLMGGVVYAGGATLLGSQETRVLWQRVRRHS